MASEASRVNQEYYEDVPAGRRDYWRKMAACRHRVDTILTELGRYRPGTILDLGCGDGALLEEIERMLPNALLAGVDISSRQVALNQRSRPGVRWFVCDLDGDFVVSEEGSEFDALIAAEVIEHLDYPDRFLRSALTLAGPQCHLFLSTQSGPLRETERRVGHRRHYTPDDLSRLLIETGWKPVRTWNTGYPFHDLSKWYANLNPDRSLSEFGEKPYGFRENAICWTLRQAFRLNSQRRGAQLFAVATR